MKQVTFLLLFFFSHFGYSQSVSDLSWIFGLTIEDPWSNTADIVDAFSSHCLKPTARIVFDENIAATEYTNAVNQLAPACFLMGEILDSYFVNNYSVADYLARTTEYLDEFEEVVDIWEVGNEVNGDWLGAADEVVQKIEGSFNQVKSRNKLTALTLYYNQACYYDHPENELFTWVNENIPDAMKQGLDYVLVSYYEDDCEDTQLTEAEWQTVFDDLHTIFPNSKLGMGECGTMNVANKAEFMDRYYNMNISTPNYIGGYFWWYYQDDCVPKTNELWTTINDISCDQLVLPVEYLSPFRGKANKNQIDLFWTTSLELDADYFQVEKLSNDLWQSIGTIPSGKSNYHLVDTHPSHGENLYRLNQVDLDGKQYYSQVVSVYFKETVLTILPNPASSFFQIQFNNKPRHIYIKNSLGQTVLELPVSEQFFQIDFLPKGLIGLR